MPYDIPEIVERVYARFYRMWPLLDPQDAKQQAILVCLMKADTWNGALSSAPTFFSMVARHAITNAHEKEATHRRQHPVSSNQSNGVGNEMIHSVPAPCKTEPAEAAEIASRVQCVLSTLSPLVRDLIAAEGDPGAKAAILKAAGITRQAGDKRVRKAHGMVTRNLSPLI